MKFLDLFTTTAKDLFNYARDNHLSLSSKPHPYRTFPKNDDPGFAEGKVNIDPPTSSHYYPGTANSQATFFSADTSKTRDIRNEQIDKAVEKAAQNSANHPVRFLIAVACISAIAFLFHEGCRSHETNHSQNPEHSESFLEDVSASEKLLYQALSQTYPLKDTSIPFSSDTDASNDD